LRNNALGGPEESNERKCGLAGVAGLIQVESPVSNMGQGTVLNLPPPTRSVALWGCHPEIISTANVVERVKS
ncbi:hypothetical protein, partial [Escherichia coli]|uniref:hypothetical protein n=1 Tax=Escherichia coli TaxID=562 RepID=UPI001F1A75B3